MNIASVDLKCLHEELASEIEIAVSRVLKSGWYILGPEVEAFEAEFAAYHGLKHAVAVANGTDAIELALRAHGIGAGDEVISVAHTAVPTITAIERTGATAVLVDIDSLTYTMNPQAVAAAITPRTRALVPVHLYGHPADISALRALADAHHLALIEDCAQGHGAQWHGQRVGTFGQAAAFSFYPTKNLGAYGDAGMIITDDDATADRLKKLRNYGQEVRYQHVEWGINSRMDEIQAAILRVKLLHLDKHTAERRQLAAFYNQHLTGITPPTEADGAFHVYHLYVIQHPERDALQKALRDDGIQTLIHYPIPVHLQKAFQHLKMAEGALPITEGLAKRIVSLPLYNGLRPEQLEAIVHSIGQFKGTQA